MKKNNIKITIITVSFNSEKTIEETIKSVKNQDYADIEYIIIDGKSTDRTLSIIKKYNGIKCISEPDQGIYDAMNKGVLLATGDYIQIIGSDDKLIEHSTISKVVSEIENDVDILSTGIFMVDNHFKLKKYCGNTAVRDKLKYDGSMIPHPGLFVRTTLMKKFLFNTSYKSAADYEFFLKCYLNKKILFKYVDIPSVYFSLGGISSTDSIGINEHLTIMKNHNLEKSLIEKVEEYKKASSSNFYKKRMKSFLGRIGLLKYILRIKGWSKYELN